MANKIKILHLIHDDKFFDAVFELFNLVGCHNKFVILSKPYLLKYIKKVQYVDFIPIGSDEYNEIFKNQIDIVIVHFLHSYYKETIIRFKEQNNAKLYWSSWGGDFYDLINFPLYQSKTQDINSKFELLKKADTSNHIIFIKKISSFTKSLFVKEHTLLDAINCFDYCSTVLPNEFELLKRYSWFRAKQVLFNYPFPEDFDFEKKNVISGNSIIVGNSYTWTNNHAEVFDSLKRLSLGNRKIIVPLSYGLDYKTYPWLLNLGVSYFGENFIPITEFMSLSEYNKLLSSCSISVFNTERQQALGNIVLLLYQGAKVFLSENSPTYQYFKNNGVFVFSVQSDLNDLNINTTLTSHEIEINRQFLKREWSYESIQTKVKNAIQTILLCN